MSLLFTAFAAMLTAAVVLMLAPILWRGTRTNRVASSTVNAAVLRDQLAELEHDRASGILAAAEHQQAKQELQRRALEEVSTGAAVILATGQSKLAAVLFATLLPLAASVTYIALGNPSALSQAAARPPQIAQPDIEKMVASLADKLKRNPDDPKGWAMLGRSYRVLGRYDDAVQAFVNAGTALDSDPQLLFEYAQALAMTRNGALDGEPTRLLERALTLAPQFPAALALAGSAAFERGAYKTAIEYWQRLQAQLPPGSDGAKAVTNSIEKARSAQAGQPARAPG